MAAHALSPLNVSLTSQWGTVQYAPARDGPLDGGWNLTYPASPSPGFGVAGTGPSVHRTTLAGAALSIAWTGTAAYLYGASGSGGYSVRVDGAPVAVVADEQQGMLASVAGLAYGAHVVTLENDAPGEMDFTGAALTVVMGVEGSTVQNTSIPVVLEDSSPAGGTLNPVFSVGGPGGSGGSWTIVNNTEDQYAGPDRYRMATQNNGDTFAFNLTAASAFYLYGSMHYDHGGYVAIFTPPPDVGPAKSTPLSALSSVWDPSEVMYWESGLDRRCNYTVEIVNTSPSNNTMIAIRSLLITDWIPPELPTAPASGAVSSSTAASSITPSSSHGVATSTVVLAVVASLAFLALAALIIFLLLRCRRARRTRSAPPIPGRYHRIAQVEPYLADTFTRVPLMRQARAPVPSTPECRARRARWLTDAAGPAPPYHAASRLKFSRGA